MEEGKYDEVLEACVFKIDLEILTGGDMIEIGEKVCWFSIGLLIFNVVFIY